jgi:hypothetical protein
MGRKTRRKAMADKRFTTKEGYTPEEAAGDVEQETHDPKGEVRTPGKQPPNVTHIVGTCPPDAGQYDELRGSLKMKKR